MRILGICNHKDATAAFIEDGRIKRAVSEERFTRAKLQDGVPRRAIQWIFEKENLNIADIDIIAYGWSKGVEPAALEATNKRLGEEIAKQDMRAIEIIHDRIRSEIANQTQFRNAFLEEFSDHKDKIELVDHHKAHAASAYYTSPYSEALVVTLDGKGDFKSGSASIASNQTIEELECVSTLDSLGYFYGLITKSLGFQTERHEGKVTGLAAYGDPSVCLPIMQSMIGYQDGEIRSNLGDFYQPWFMLELVPGLEALAKHRKEDVAAAVQTHLEEIVCSYIDDRARKHGLKSLCLAGGIFGNVKLNQRIRELDSIDEVFVHPAMGDGGLALGAALHVSNIRGKYPARPIRNAYFGPDFDALQIEEALEGDNLFVHKFDTDEQKTKVCAALLDSDTVLGWFSGRVEYGPRALGARSILYHPKDSSVNKWLNDRLHRTEFMPFAPATIDSLAADCFVGWQPSHLCAEFMTMCYDCTERMKELAPAVTHVDGTARPQIVIREQNPQYYDLIECYYRRSDVPCIVNTSFNAHEEPIVLTPDDAIKGLRENLIDALAIESFLVALPQNADRIKAALREL